MTGRICLAVLVMLVAVFAAPARFAAAAESPVYSVDFTGFPGGDVLKWLGTKGFVPKQDANNGRKVASSDRPPLGELVTTEYPITEAFTRIFGKSEAPDVSGFGISIDTSSAKGKGTARAFVRKIEFLK